MGHIVNSPAYVLCRKAKELAEKYIENGGYYTRQSLAEYCKNHGCNEIEQWFLSFLACELVYERHTIFNTPDLPGDEINYGFGLYGAKQNELRLDLNGFSRSVLRIHIIPQVSVGPYRVDYVLQDITFELPPYVIEIDGHEWHEKTKAQASQDKKRERFLIKNGYKVLRFTGSDVYNQVHVCWAEIIETLFLELERVEGKKQKEAHNV